MNILQFDQFVSTLAARMMSFMVSAIGSAGGVKAAGGLPAGAIHIREAKLILATTCCAKPLFHTEMHRAAAETGADVILMRHGMHPEALNAVQFDVLIHVNGYPCLVTDLVLYHDRIDGWWLVPGSNGAHIALEADGLRLADEPPFVTWSERCDAVCRAAREIALAARRSETR